MYYVLGIFSSWPHHFHSFWDWSRTYAARLVMSSSGSLAAKVHCPLGAHPTPYPGILFLPLAMRA